MPLAPGTVHVWRTRLDVSAATELACARLLAADERERAAAFRFPADRRRFVVARAVQRLLLARLVGRAAGELRFETTRLGKPRLGGSEGPQFNVSHSHELAAYAFGADAVGIDVEHVRPLTDALAIARRFFAVPEVATVERAAPADLANTFFRYWTRKEAYIKATGEGLSADLQSIDVATDRDRALVLDGERAVRDSGLCLRSLSLPPGYVGAVAAYGQVELREFEWPRDADDEGRRMFEAE